MDQAQSAIDCTLGPVTAARVASGDPVRIVRDELGGFSATLYARNRKAVLAPGTTAQDACDRLETTLARMREE